MAAMVAGGITMLFVQTAPQSFWAWANWMTPTDRAILSALVLLAIVATVAIVAGTVYKIHKNRLEDALKRELLDRGMKPDEIVALVGAKPTNTRTDIAKGR